MEKVQIFQDKKVRTHWDAELERRLGIDFNYGEIATFRLNNR